MSENRRIEEREDEGGVTGKYEHADRPEDVRSQSEQEQESAEGEYGQGSRQHERGFKQATSYPRERH